MFGARSAAFHALVKAARKSYTFQTIGLLAGVTGEYAILCSLTSFLWGVSPFSLIRGAVDRSCSAYSISRRSLSKKAPLTQPIPSMNIIPAPSVIALQSSGENQKLAWRSLNQSSPHLWHFQDWEERIWQSRFGIKSQNRFALFFNAALTLRTHLKSVMKRREAFACPLRWALHPLWPVQIRSKVSLAN